MLLFLLFNINFLQPTHASGTSATDNANTIQYSGHVMVIDQTYERIVLFDQQYVNQLGRDDVGEFIHCHVLQFTTEVRQTKYHKEYKKFESRVYQNLL